jgi:hypothetical protein
MDMTYEDYQDYINSVCDQMSVQEYLFWFQHLFFQALTNTPPTTIYLSPQEDETV